MNFRSVFHIVSILLIVTGVAIAACWLISIFYHDAVQAQLGLAYSSMIVLASGLLLWLLTRGPVDLSRRDGFGIVTFGWLGVALFGSIVYDLTGTAPTAVDAFFETMSGFTTTGASVLTNLEDLPRGVLFWRSITQWFGGLGVVVLCVAILPFLGVGGMQIYQAEMPGPSKDRLTPRITSTAKLLWAVYVLLSAVQTLLLKFAGMSWFDALCHTFTTMSTGGFSTRTASVAAYNSSLIEAIIVVFMFLAAVNFSLHFRALRGKPVTYFRDPEFRFFAAFWLLAGLMLTFDTWQTIYPSFKQALRYSFFQSTSIMTTTGFATDDFNVWPAASKITLVLLMFMGGCAGSTAGGMKSVRLFILIKKTLREIRLFMLPQAIVQVKLGRKPVHHDIVSKITTFFIIFVFLFAAATLVMSFYTHDIQSAASAVIATLGNIGPGFGLVGPLETYAPIAPGGKLVLTFCMLLGRLELYTVLVLFLPSFWKK